MYALMIAAAAVLSTPTFAMFEVKGHYDVLTATPSGFNTQMEDYVQGAPDVTGVTGYGADATFKFPVLPIVVGLRYDTLHAKKTGPARISGTAVNTTSELTGTRTALLAGWRLISTPVGYVGVLGHVTAAQTLGFKMTSTNAVGAQSKDSFTGTTGTGYGAGAEAGLTYGRAVIGAEVGYTMLKASKFTSGGDEALDDSARSLKLDLSGPYAKISVGGRF